MISRQFCEIVDRSGSDSDRNGRMGAERRHQFPHAPVVGINMRTKDKRFPQRSILPQKTRLNIPTSGLICVSVGNNQGFLRAEHR